MCIVSDCVHSLAQKIDFRTSCHAACLLGLEPLLCSCVIASCVIASLIAAFINLDCLGLDIIVFILVTTHPVLWSLIGLLMDA